MSKVCILTAGKGNRLGKYTTRFNKALLPVGNKAVISHIIDSFSSDTQFVIAVGHEKEKVIEYIKNSYPNGSFVFAEVENYSGPGSGPGCSLYSCKEYLQEPFLYFACDTLIDFSLVKEPTENWIGISKTKTTEDFCTVAINGKKITRIDDKKKVNNKHAFVGIGGVFDYELFWKHLWSDREEINGELQISNGLKGLPNLNYIEFPKWHDTGNINAYTSSRNAFSDGTEFDKENEITYFVNNRIVKYFDDTRRVLDRHQRSKLLGDICPDVIKTKWFCSYEKIEGNTLYSCLKSETTFQFLNWCKEYLWKSVDCVEFKKLCWKFYFNKTMERISLFDKKYPNIDHNLKHVINGCEIDSLSSILQKIDWESLCGGTSVIIHGDLQFDNVLETTPESVHSDGRDRKEQFKLLDWRENFSGNLECGDLYYDLAKLYGGLTIPYSEIKKKNFSFTESGNNISFSYQTLETLDSCRNVLEKFIIDEKFDLKKVKILRGLIFLNMAPLHSEPFDKMLYYMSKVYLENAINDH